MLTIQEEKPRWTFYNDEKSTRRKQQQQDCMRARGDRFDAPLALTTLHPFIGLPEAFKCIFFAVTFSRFNKGEIYFFGSNFF